MTLSDRPRRAGIYVRISQDREGGGLGVERQRQDCLDLADRLGWTVIDLYSDNDISAYGGKVRPQYVRLLDDVRAGRIDAILAWHADRLHRQPRELEDFIDVIRPRDVVIRTVKAGELDLSTDTGQMIARMLGAAAAAESAQKATRIRRKALELAQGGKLSGGGTRPYGYENDRMTINAIEAAYIREATQRVIAGEALRGVAMDFNTRGLRTTTGREWLPITMRRMLVSPRIAGLRQHVPVEHSNSGARMRKIKEGVAYPAVWDGIITTDQHERLKRLLLDPARQTNGGQTIRKYLLTGLLFCWRCDQRLIARPTGGKDPNLHQRSYCCAAKPIKNTDPAINRKWWCGNGGLRIQAEPLEELISEAVLQRLDGDRLRKAVAQATGDDKRAHAAQAQIDRLTNAITSLAAERDDGLIGQAEYTSRRISLNQRVDQQRAIIATLSADQTLASLPSGGQLRAAWPSWTIHQKRAVLDAVIEKIVVGPGRRGVNKFDAKRIDPNTGIHWRV